MRRVAEPITAPAFQPFGALVARPAVSGRTPLSGLVTWSDPEAQLRASFSRIEPTDLPLVVRQMERHRHSCQMFLPVTVARYLVVVAPDQGGAPRLAGVRAFLVPADLGIIYAIDCWHCPMCVLDSTATFVVLMAVSGTDRDEAWSTLPEPLTVDAPPAISASG